jgi:hypothetical protein
VDAGEGVGVRPTAGVDGVGDAGWPGLPGEVTMGWRSATAATADEAAAEPATWAGGRWPATGKSTGAAKVAGRLGWDGAAVEAGVVPSGCGAMGFSAGRADLACDGRLEGGFDDTLDLAGDGEPDGARGEKNSERCAPGPICCGSTGSAAAAAARTVFGAGGPSATW